MDKEKVEDENDNVDTQYVKSTRFSGEPGKGLDGLPFILNERAVVSYEFKSFLIYAFLKNLLYLAFRLRETSCCVPIFRV